MAVDREYRIRIVSTAEGTGIQDAARDIQESGKHLGALNAHGREAHEIFHKLDEVVPGLGLGFKALFNQGNIELAGFLIILRQAVELFGEWKKRAEETSDALAKAAVDKWSSMADYAREATRATADLQANIDKAATSTDTLLRKDQLVLEVLEKQLAVKLKLAGGEGERAALEGLGFEDRVAQMEANRQSAEHAAAGAQVGFNAAASARAAGPVGFEGVAGVKNDIEAHKDDVQKALAAQAKSREDVESTRALISQGGADPRIAFTASQRLPGLEKELKAADRRVDAAKAAEDERKNVVAAYDQATKQLADAETAAAEEVQRLKKAAADSADAIERERALHTAEEGLNRGAAIAQAGLTPGPLGNTLYSIASGFRRQAAGGGMMSAREQELSRRLYDALRVQGETPDQISMLVTRLTDLQFSLADQVKFINQRLNAHEQMMRYNLNAPQ